MSDDASVADQQAAGAILRFGNVGARSHSSNAISPSTMLFKMHYALLGRRLADMKISTRGTGRRPVATFIDAAEFRVALLRKFELHSKTL